jgi:hypothetical protein
MLASHRGGPGLRPGRHVGFVVDKAALGRFSPSTSVSPANHSTNYSIIIITRGWNDRPISGRSAELTLGAIPNIPIKKKTNHKKQSPGSNYLNFFVNAILNCRSYFQLK